MDDERYARYLDEDFFGTKGSSGTDRKFEPKDGRTSAGLDTGAASNVRGAGSSTFLGVQNGVQKAFFDARDKLGLHGLSKGSALVLALVILALCAFGVWSYSPSFREFFLKDDQQSSATLVKADDGSDDLSQHDLEAGTDGEEVPANLGNSLYVYVSGAVKQPDVYELAAGSRAIDALNAAGGFLDSAASEALNLAAELEDGTQIHVLTKKEFKEQGGSAAAIASGSSDSSQGGIGSATGVSSDGLVNLNTADSTTLQTLPGIGPVTADKIVKDREINGPYSSLEDLTRVSGIGPKRVEGLEGVASVGP